MFFNYFTLIKHTRFECLIGAMLCLGPDTNHCHGEEAAKSEKKPNIIFIAIDDMNDWSSVFGKDNPIKTPNFERLARRGVFFTHAYCASPSCNPPKAALLTCKRPHKTGIYSNASDWRGTLPDTKTIQRFFKDNGYFVCGSGMIFHHHLDWAFHDNESFHEYLIMSVNEPYPPAKLNGFEWFGTRNTDWGIWPENIRETADYRTAEYAVQKLQEKFDQPFMLNVGIYKPHSPYYAPKEYFRNYPHSAISMPLLNRTDWEDLPSGARNLVNLTNQGFDSGVGFWKGLMEAKKTNSFVFEDFVQAYQACATCADAMIGRVIDALDKGPYKENTIIILFSDNGFDLGEKDHIEKLALWEKTTHVPLIFVASGKIKEGIEISKPVDLTSIYPTLIDLCSLGQKTDLDCKSLMPVLSNPGSDFPPALMTYMKGNHAIRTERWRFIQYADGTEELYDHFCDKNEWTNLAENPHYKIVLDNFIAFVPKFNAEQVPDMIMPNIPDTEYKQK